MSAKQIIELSVHLMPLMWREFQVRVSPQRMADDPAYAHSLVELATSSREPRVARYAQQIRQLLPDCAPPAAPAEPSQAKPEAAPAQRYIKSLR